MTDRLDTSLAALPPNTPDIDPDRKAGLLARFDAQYPDSPQRISTVDLWAVECRGCGGRLNVFVRYDEFHPEPARRICDYCRGQRGHRYARWPKREGVEPARKWFAQAKRVYYEALMAARHDDAAYDIPYARAELRDAADLVAARMREEAGDRARAAYASVVAAKRRTRRRQGALP
jgi:hypothetical protein